MRLGGALNSAWLRAAAAAQVRTERLELRGAESTPLVLITLRRDP